MYGSYLFPFYRSPFIGYPAYPGYGPGYGPGYYNNNVSNIIGSAVANQSMTTIGAGAIGGIQVATPTVVW